MVCTECHQSHCLIVYQPRLVPNTSAANVSYWATLEEIRQAYKLTETKAFRVLKMVKESPRRGADYMLQDFASADTMAIGYKSSKEDQTYWFS